MHEIGNDRYRALIAPGAGGAVMALEYQGRNIMRPAPSVEAIKADPRQAACFPCVPWFGRLFGGLDFDGRHYDLAPTLPACDPAHALHGEGWINSWTVTSGTQTSLKIRFDHAQEADKFPFSFRAEQSFSVGEAFEIDLSVTNTGDAPMPAGLGLHPFFPRHEKTRLRYSADRLWTPEPAGGGSFVAPLPAGYDFSGGTPLAAAMDHTYIAWAGDTDIVNGRETINIQSNASFLHIYAPADERFFCLEPVTHLPGKFGQEALRPAATMSIFCRISISTTHTNMVNTE